MLRNAKTREKSFDRYVKIVENNEYKTIIIIEEDSFSVTCSLRESVDEEGRDDRKLGMSSVIHPRSDVFSNGGSKGREKRIRRSLI